MTPRGTPVSLYETLTKEVRGEVTLRDVIGDLKRARLFILLGAVAGVLVASAFFLAAVPYYRAQIILSPASPLNGAESSSMLANDNLFALRFLVQRMGGGNSDFTRFESTHAGPRVARALMEDRRIMEGISHDRPFRFSRSPQDWNAEKLAAYFAAQVRIEPVGTGGMRRMVYWHPDPQFAVYLLGRLHDVTDTMIREAVRNDAAQRVEYLSRAIATTGNPEHKRALATLLMEQERLRMLVSIDQPYAAMVIEPASASYKPEWPDPALVFAAFVLMGGLAGYLLFGWRNAG